MKFFGDLGFLDTSKGDSASSPQAGEGPELVALTREPRREELPSALANGSASAGSSGADHYAAAVRHYLKGELDEALEDLEKARAAGKELAEVYTALAQIQLDRKKFSDAAEYYVKLLAIEPDNSAAQFNAGLALQATEKYVEAKSSFQTAIDLDPELADAYLGLVGCCLKLDDAEGAKAAYESYLKAEPDSYAAVFGLGVAYHLSEDYDKAVDYYQAALKENPKSVEVLPELCTDSA